MNTNYFLIESRDPFESRDSEQWRRLTADLASGARDVTLFLVQDGVLGARRCAVSQALTDLAGKGVTILADDFSLAERGIGPDDLADGVTTSSLDVVLDALADGHKTLWH